MSKPLPWQDALRLLRKRQELVRGIADPSLGDSLQAFLAWRAFLIVARGTHPNQREKEQCRRMLVSALESAPEMLPLAEGLVRGLRGLDGQSDPFLALWYCDDDAEPATQAAQVAEARRGIKRLVEYGRGSSIATPKAAAELGNHVYAIRSAVLAHASVTTIGNLFASVVPPFGALVATAACSGIAARADRPLSEVLREASLTHD